MSGGKGVATIGKPLPDALATWVAAAPAGWTAGGPEGTALCRLATFDWSLLVWP